MMFRLLIYWNRSLRALRMDTAPLLELPRKSNWGSAANTNILSIYACLGYSPDLDDAHDLTVVAVDMDAPNDA